MFCSSEIYSTTCFVYSAVASTVFLSPPPSPHIVTMLGAVLVLFEIKIWVHTELPVNIYQLLRRIPIFGYFVEVSDWIVSMITSKSDAVFLQCKYAVM